MSIRVTVTGNAQSIRDAVEAKTRAMLLDLHGGLVLKSPVGETGNFRADWTVDTVAGTIENNKEYAEALANGHSAQAPKGWIEAEIDRATRL